jgi:hypothetical protein
MLTNDRNKYISTHLLSGTLNQLSSRIFDSHDFDRLSPAVGDSCKKCKEIGTFCRDGWIPCYETAWSCKCCGHLRREHV